VSTQTFAMMVNVSFISTEQDVIQPALIFYTPSSAHEDTSRSDAGSSEAFYVTHYLRAIQTGITAARVQHDANKPCCCNLQKRPRIDHFTHYAGSDGRCMPLIRARSRGNSADPSFLVLLFGASPSKA